LFEVAIKFFNHPEMMVRNAIRIIALNVFKIAEDAGLTRALTQELPLAIYLAHLACQLRDKVLDLDQSY
jgi:hypothetical protein